MKVGDFLRDTRNGFKRPDLGDDQATVFIHTTKCIYALDDEGVCRYAIATDGAALAKIDRCVGAQYVAGLEPFTETALVPDPRVGAHALFVGRGAGVRMALIKTPPIVRVVYAEDAISSSDVEWVDEEVQKSWLRSTRIGGPAVIERAGSGQ